jgi:hypothetical protein
MLNTPSWCKSICRVLTEGSLSTWIHKRAFQAIAISLFIMLQLFLFIMIPIKIKIKVKKHRVLHGLTPMGQSILKITSHWPPASRAHYFGNAPALGRYPTLNTFECVNFEPNEPGLSPHTRMSILG